MRPQSLSPPEYRTHPRACQKLLNPGLSRDIVPTSLSHGFPDHPKRRFSSPCVARPLSFAANGRRVPSFCPTESTYAERVLLQSSPVKSWGFVRLWVAAKNSGDVVDGTMIN